MGTEEAGRMLLELGQARRQSPASTRPGAADFSQHVPSKGGPDTGPRRHAARGALPETRQLRSGHSEVQLHARTAGAGQREKRKQSLQRTRRQQGNNHRDT